MIQTPISSDILIADLFIRWPQTIPVFLSRRMSCVGCSMARFDTLAEAAQNYELLVDDFIAELLAAVQKDAAGSRRGN